MRSELDSAQLNQALASGEYTYELTPPAALDFSWFKEFMRWLGRLFEGREVQLDALEYGFYTFLWLAIGYFLYYLISKTTVAAPRARAEQSLFREGESLVHSDFASLAAQAEQEGNTREQIRYIFLASLQALNRLQKIEYADWKSNRLYERELKGTDQFRFHLVYSLYERVWYGRKEPLAEAIQKQKMAYNALTNELD